MRHPNTNGVRSPILLLSSLLAACAHGPRGERASYSLGEVDEPPRLIECGSYEEPTSTDRSRLANITVYFDVSPAGEVMNPTTVAPASLAADRLVSVALRAARSCHYEPGRVEGRPVPVSGPSHTFRFRY